MPHPISSCCLDFNWSNHSLIVKQLTILTAQAPILFFVEQHLSWSYCMARLFIANGISSTKPSESTREIRPASEIWLPPTGWLNSNSFAASSEGHSETHVLDVFGRSSWTFIAESPRDFSFALSLTKDPLPNETRLLEDMGY